MKIDGTYIFTARAGEVWDLLLDPQVLLQIIPGLQKVDVQGDTILASATVGVGPVKGLFSGRISLLDQRKPTHVRIVGEGKGGPGFMKGVCIIDAAEHDGQTTISYQANVQIGGTLATVGQRLVDAATQQIMQQGFGAFNRVLGVRQATAAEARRLADLAAAERAAWQAAVFRSQAIQSTFPRWFVVLLPALLIAATLALAFGH
ncbi:MAG: carbon monoxide dehydrogenase subunit G [Chloroflexi bacterium]|nr:carbon monoxide dehydrogenase subunit G [Chloroflexota bacterium]